jgi:hypothetical protein
MEGFRDRLAPLLMLLICSCAPEEPSFTALISDSAGIRILESRDTGSVDILRGPPDRELGTVNSGGPEQFDRIVGLDVLKDGSLVVADQGSGEIRVFPPGGGSPLILGRQGDGPGEFSSLARVFVLEGDSILGFDSRGARYVVFSRDGTPKRTGTLLPPASGGRTQLEGILPDGSWLGSVRIPAAIDAPVSGFGEAFQDSVFLYRYSPEGDPADLLGRSVSLEMVRQRQASARITHLVPLGSEGLWGLAGGRPFSLLSSLSEIRFLGEKPTVWVRWHPLQVELTDGEWGHSLEEAIVATDPSRAPLLRERYAEIPRPIWRPIYDAAVGAESGSVWLHETGSSNWVVVAPDGYVRTIILPEGFTPRLVLNDRILGVWTDDLDVEFVREYGPQSTWVRETR